WVHPNAGKGQFFKFDDAGELVMLISEVRGSQKEIKYLAQFDEEGRMISQTEHLGDDMVVRLFEYNDLGQQEVMYNVKGIPMEIRRYDVYGRLSDFMLYTPEGHAREVFTLQYDFYRPDLPKKDSLDNDSLKK
ncbi:MAG: hypothetical protein AAF570_29230, partial [Bacteroidota bacterium]